ncbi:MAG: hypothetical protein ACUVS7_17345 [Bryobacteraceae bacterium]
MKHFQIILSFLAVSAAAQPLHFGLRGGFAFQDVIDSRGNLRAASRHWTLGPAAELSLPFGFAAGADLLYRRLEFQDPGSNTANSWTVPLLVKYYLPGDVARYFLEAGPTFRSLGNLPRLEGDATKGFALGTGVRFGAGLARFSMGLRYSRYGQGRGLDVNAPPGTLRTKENQLDLLFGLTF